MPSCRACSAPNNPNYVSLSELLHEVPKLWDSMPSSYLNVLLGVNKEVRRQAQGRVACIRTTGAMWPEQVHHLTKGGWSQLRCLDFVKQHHGGYYYCSAESGTWPLLQSLTLAKGWAYELLPSYSENVYSQFNGKWPVLEILTVALHKIDIAQATVLTEVSWPRLQTLCINPCDDAVPALMKGNWPDLKDLSLEIGLNDRELGHLSDLPWSTLQRLRLKFWQVTSSGIYSLIQAHLPKLQELSVWWHTEGDNCFAMLTLAKWPLLSKLELIGADATHEGIRHLVTGQCSMPANITDQDMPLLVQADWPNVQNLTLIGHFEHMEVLDVCMRKWPALQTLRLGFGPDQTHCGNVFYCQGQMAITGSSAHCKRIQFQRLD